MMTKRERKKALRLYNQQLRDLAQDDAYDAFEMALDLVNDIAKRGLQALDDELETAVEVARG